MGEISGTMLKGVKELEVCLPVREVEELKRKGKVEVFHCLHTLTWETKFLSSSRLKGNKIPKLEFETREKQSDERNFLTLSVINHYKNSLGVAEDPLQEAFKLCLDSCQ